MNALRSIEEIDADLKLWTNARNEAEKTLAALRAEKEARRLSDSGLAGHVVSYHRDRVGTEIRFVVERIRYGSDLEGPVVRKDGTIGTKRASATAATVTDLGLYSKAEGRS